MNVLRCHLLVLSRIALLAMATLVLLPTVAQAMVLARGGQAVTEVCTPQGMKLVVLEAGEQISPVDAAKSALGHLDHCPFCATAAHAMAPPPAAPKLRQLPAAGAAAAPLFLQGPRTLHAWVVAHPRGPPALS